MWQFLTKLNILLPCDPAIALLGSYPPNTENLCPHKNLYIYVYCSLIHNCQNLEALSYPSVGEWISKLWYIQTMEYYSALKRNELSSLEKTWRKLKCILLSERSQTEKVTCYMILAI